MNRTYKLEKEKSSSILTVLVPEDRINLAQENNKRNRKDTDANDDDDSVNGSTYDNGWKQLSSSISVTSMDYSVNDSVTSRRSNGTMISKYGGSTNFMSYKEIVSDIEKMAKSNQPPPDYLTTIDKLPALLTSWDGRKKKKLALMKKLKEEIGEKGPEAEENDDENGKGNATRRKLLHKLEKLVQRPVINLMGCHYQADLIMAKANERARKQQHASSKSKQYARTRLETLETLREEKNQRKQSYAMLRERRKLQMNWLISLTMLKFLDRINDYAGEIKKKIANMFNAESASSIIIRVLVRWYQRFLFRKYRLGFEKAVKKSRGRLVLGIRIMKKQLAIRKLRWLFLECKPKPAMANIVHRFVKNVHFLQRIFHSFCKCKAARIAIITKIWDQYEAKYVKKKLREKKDKRVLGKSSNFETLDIDIKLKIEMEKQDEKWQLADMKMEEQLMRVEAVGNLSRASDADAITKLLLDDQAKYSACRAIVEHARRTHLEEQRELFRKFAGEATCSTSDAKQLLSKGDDLQSLEKKINKQLCGFRTKNFHMFNYITRRKIIDAIKNVHELHGTFV